MSAPVQTLPNLTRAWLALVVLTLISLGLGQWLAASQWLSLPVAGVIWLKSAIVARRFIGLDGTHPFVVRLVHTFIALAPLALVATAFFGDTIARWATL